LAIKLPSFFSVDDFAGTDCVIAAVSGGSDSLAMLFLLRDYFTHSICKKRLVAVTVDHSLRPASAQESSSVAYLCAAYDIAHETLVWHGDKPQKAVAHLARIARYDLLCQTAEIHDAGVIVTGHTLDDQAETYTMRALRGRSGRGVAAMPRLALLRKQFRLLRPLLCVRRLTLRHYLAGLRIVWFDDPSNDDLHYERSRVRKCLDNDAVMYACRAVSVAAQKRQKESEAVAGLAIRLRMCLRSERLWFNLTSLRTNDMKNFAVLIAMSAAIMGGVQYPVIGRRSLIDFLMRKSSATSRRMTLSGSVIEMTETFLRIWREKRNIKSCILKPGQSTVWDGRYRVINDSDEVVMLRPPSWKKLQQIISAATLSHNETPEQDLHFPSLETTCMICGRSGFDLPVLKTHESCNKDIRIERIMLPFDWLVSGHDLAMFRLFQSVFTVKIREKNYTLISH